MNTVRANASQKRFYLLDRLEPSAARTLVKRIDISGDIDHSRLVETIRNVVRSSPCLRSSIVTIEDEIYVREHRADEVSIKVLVCDRPDDETQAVDRDEAVDRLRAAFEHDGAPLTRVLLVKGPAKTVLYFAVHHAIFDDFSTPLLFEALTQGYDRPTVTREPQTGRERLSASHEQTLKSYWTVALGFAEAATSLPEPVHVTRSHRRITRERALDPMVVKAMTKAVREKGLTFFTQIASAFASVASWYLDQDRIIVMTGCQPSWRTAANGMGCLQNTLPIPLDVGACRSYANLAEHVRGGILDAYEHGELPVEDIAVLAPHLRTAYAQKPLSDVVLTTIDETRTARIGGAAWTMSELPPLDTEYPLTLTLVSQDGRPHLIRAEWPHGQFDGETMESLLKHTAYALRKILLDGGEQLTDTVLLDTDDIDELRRMGTGPVRPTVETTSVDVIAAMGRRDPASTAVVFDGGETSFGELLARMHRIAAGLRRAGVSSGDRVAMALPKGEWFVPTMLGISWAGATFVPIDAEHPASRIDQILSDSQPTVIVSKTVRRSTIPTVSPSDLAAGAEDGSQGSTVPDQVSYIIYTSGTSGRPKGVQIEDRSLVRFVTAFDERIATASGCVVAAGSITFDAIVVETFWPLITGRRMILTDHKRLLSRAIPPSAVYQCTPTVARTHLATTPGRKFLSALDTLLLTGEKVAPDLAGSLDEIMPGRVFNGYGPTEATIMSHIDRIADPKRPTVGWPLSGASCDLVDRHGRPLPPGWPGEVIIGGSGLARGYWRRSDLTEKKFRPFPLLNLDRGYATGDIAVLDRSLGFEVLGRNDDQIKIMGQRVEPEEIEACLRDVDWIADAAVSVVETSVFAWICAKKPVKAERHAEIRQALKERLPSAFVPTRIVEVESLPQLPSGKLDRATLLERAKNTVSLDVAVPEGAASSEELVATIWSDVLGRDIGLDDDAYQHSFFERGGTSSSAIRAFDRLARYYPDISLADLFTHTSLPDLAAFLNAQPARAPAPDTRPSGAETTSRMAAMAAFANRRAKETPRG